MKSNIMFLIILSLVIFSCSSEDVRVLYSNGHLGVISNNKLNIYRQNFSFGYSGPEFNWLELPDSVFSLPRSYSNLEFTQNNISFIEKNKRKWYTINDSGWFEMDTSLLLWDEIPQFEFAYLLFNDITQGMNFPFNLNGKIIDNRYLLAGNRNTLKYYFFDVNEKIWIEYPEIIIRLPNEYNDFLLFSPTLFGIVLNDFLLLYQLNGNNLIETNINLPLPNEYKKVFSLGFNIGNDIIVLSIGIFVNNTVKFYNLLNEGQEWQEIPQMEFNLNN